MQVNEKIDKLIGYNDMTVSDAMKKIDENAYGILFLIDERNAIVGCITDGDVRRFLLAGNKMDKMAMDAANKHPLVAYSKEEAKRLYHQRDYVVIPIINNKNEMIDFYAGRTGKRISHIYNSLSIPVVINAGGKGTRLEPFTRVLPKPLIPIGELPIIERIIKGYCKYDCNDIHVIVNYKKDLIKAYFVDNENKYNIFWHEEQKPLGTGGGLSLLRDKIDETFFFANCDTLVTADYYDMLRFHKENENMITMICAYKSINIPYGVVEMGAEGIIENMKEKPTVSFLTNTGMYIVEPEVIQGIEKDKKIDFPEIIEEERARGRRVAAFPIRENEWSDMGQVSELEKMKMKLLGECEVI